MAKKQSSQQTQQTHENSSFDIAQRDLGSNQDRLSGMQSSVYKVVKGDSFWSISNAMGLSMTELLMANNLNERDIIHPGTSLNVPNHNEEADSKHVSEQVSEHIVGSGDSLWDIADKYNVSFGSLLSLNQMNLGTTLYPGMKITIPGGSSASSNKNTPRTAEYRVANGDSLWLVSNKFGVSISALENANNLHNSTIHPGQVLKIPTESSARVQNTSKEPTTQEKKKPSNSQNGYDPVLGKALARDSMSEASGRTRAGGDCYYGVANSVDRVVGKFLTGMHAYMAASQLAQRKNLFTEVPATSLRSLPAGAIVVWGKGTSDSGHISIAQGNGMETSDFIGNQMTYHYGGAAARVFLPKGRM